MSKLALSMRIDSLTDRQEVRISIDEKLMAFFYSLGADCILVHYSFKSKQELIDFLTLNAVTGIVLSGGNDIGQYTKRDEIEHWLIEYATEYDLPVIGICRGVQVIGDHFGVGLKPVKNHVSTTHNVSLSDGTQRVVNSFHRFALTACPEGFDVFCRSPDGSIEGIRAKHKNIMGIMWHPERETPFCNSDLLLMEEFLRQGDKRCVV